VEGTIITDGLFTVMDVSPTGDQILMRKEAVALGGQATDIELWRPAGKFVERVKSFTPFSGDMQGRQSVDHALLGADGKIVVASNMGRIGIFDSNSGEAIGSMPDGHSAALSPDRKYAVIVGEKVLLIDLTNGDALASFATEKLHHASAAFSPDGQLLAVASGDHLMAWSLKDGKAYRDETIGGLNAGWNSEVIFTSPTHLFAGTTLIDIENHLPVWTYNGITKAMPAGGSTVMLVDRGFQSMLVVSPLPHQAAQLAVKQALGTPGLFAVTPGSTMTVDVSALTDPAQQEKARAGLEARIAAAGMKLTPNSPIVLKASMSTSTEQQEFRTFGLRSEATPVNTTKHTATVEMLVNGKQAWQTSAVSGTGFMISTTKGESLQDAANRQSKADYSLFSTVSIPQYVLQPGMSTLGQSTVSGPNF